MINKLVVIINSPKVPKIKKILLYEMKFLVPHYSCLQNPWLGGYRPQIPVLSVLCPQLNLLNPPTPNKIPGYATVRQLLLSTPIKITASITVLPSASCVPSGIFSYGVTNSKIVVLYSSFHPHPSHLNPNILNFPSTFPDHYKWRST